jgi:hypothetical protein
MITAASSPALRPVSAEDPEGDGEQAAESASTANRRGMRIFASPTSDRRLWIIPQAHAGVSPVVAVERIATDYIEVTVKYRLAH